MRQRQTRRVSIVVPTEVYEKISFIMEEERLASFSLTASRLLQEALTRYPDPREPQLPLSVQKIRSSHEK